MCNFGIEFLPPIPPAQKHYSEFPLESLNFAETLSKIPQEYDIAYHIGDRTFRYYPSSILTVLNDLELELGLVQAGQSHPMTLCGYTVLEMVIDQARVHFYVPSGHVRGGVKAPLASYDVSFIEKSFADAMDAAWELTLKATAR